MNISLLYPARQEMHIVELLSLSKKRALGKVSECINKRMLIMINYNLENLASTESTPVLPIQ